MTEKNICVSRFRIKTDLEAELKHKCYSHSSVALSSDSFLPTEKSLSQSPLNQQCCKELGSSFQARLAELEKDSEHFPFQRSLQVSSMFHMIHNNYEVKVKNPKVKYPIWAGVFAMSKNYPCLLSPASAHNSAFPLGCSDLHPFGGSWISDDFFLGLGIFKVNFHIVENWYNNPFYQRLTN